MIRIAIVLLHLILLTEAIKLIGYLKLWVMSNNLLMTSSGHPYLEKGQFIAVLLCKQMTDCQVSRQQLVLVTSSPTSWRRGDDNHEGQSAEESTGIKKRKFKCWQTQTKIAQKIMHMDIHSSDWRLEEKHCWPITSLFLFHRPREMHTRTWLLFAN